PRRTRVHPPSRARGARHRQGRARGWQRSARRARRALALRRRARDHATRRLARLRGGAQAMKTFVLVHGFACDHTDWRFQSAFLSDKGFKVSAPDLRGHGANPAPESECSIENFGADIARLLAEKDVRDAVLVGHSMGCRVVLQAALDAPGRVGALVLIDGSWLGAAAPPVIENYANF